MAKAPKRVWFLVLPRTGMLNLAGPWEVMGHANDILGRTAYDLAVVGPRAPAFETRHGLTLGGVRPLPRAGARLPDVAIVAGAPRAAPAADQAQLVAWLRRHHARIPTVVSICTGAFVLAAAGVLDGKRATTHWMYLDELRSRFPAARVVDEGIFVRDGRIWTSAGITAGIDLALALVEEDLGAEAARKTAKVLVVFLQRPGGQSQFSVWTSTPAVRHEPLRRVLDAIALDPGGDHTIPAMAARASFSERHLSRLFEEHLGSRPGEYVEQVRLEVARAMLEGGDESLTAVAKQSGLGSEETLRRAFIKKFGVSPGAYRSRFRTTGVTGLVVPDFFDDGEDAPFFRVPVSEPVVD